MEHMTMGVGILAGGKSSRMGHDKAFLPYGNGTFLSRLLQEFSGFDEVLVSVAEDWDHERLAENVDCGSTCVFVVTDEKKDIGPLEGLRQILKHTNQEYVFVCAVDMPFVTKKLAEYISGYLSKDYDCYCIADEEHVHPLCGIYSRHMLPVVEAQIERGEYCVSAILGAVNTKYISLKYTVFDTRVTANINTKEEYGKLCTPAVFCVSGIKNAGKTGLILQLVQAFLRDGCRVGVIKHDGHEYQMDHEGTDTDRFSKAGSTCSAIYHRDHYSLHVRLDGEQITPECIRAHMPKVDVVIIEGLKHSDYPKIVVQRRGISDAAKERYTNVLCRVCDFTMESGENTTPVFDFTELPAIYACVRNALFAGDFGETGQAYD